ncbi:MAG TPA: arylesterase [Stellaceae bacterium]|nr:arylesterase [Stellaceae bacterium]
MRASAAIKHFEEAIPNRTSESGYGLWRKLVNLAAAALIAFFVIGAAAAAPTRIVAFGDSLTAGYGVLPEEAFPVRLQAWLHEHGVEAEVVNAGVSGDTSAGGLARLDWTLAEPADAVLVEFGANDALRGIDPQSTYESLDAILSKLEVRKVKVLLLGMKSPANWGREYQQSFDAIYPTLAERHHVLLYPFFLEGVVLDPNLNQGDMLHPNARGVEAIVAQVGPYVLRLLGAPTPGGNG